MNTSAAESPDSTPVWRASWRSLEAWYHETRRVTWTSPADVRRGRANVSILPNSRAVFNIKGNKYRLVVYVHYSSGLVYICFVGTHAEYDRIDATTVWMY